MIHDKSDVDTVYSLVNLKNKNFPFQVTNWDENTKTLYLDVSAILLFDTMKSLIIFEQKVFFINLFPTSFRFFIYRQSATISEIEKLRSKTSIKETEIYFDTWNYFYFLVDEADCIRLWFIFRQENVELVT